MRRLSSLLKNELVTGLLLLAPAFGTAYLIYWLVTAVDGLFPNVWRPSVWGVPLPGLGLVSVFVLALSVGIVAQKGRRLTKLVDRLLHNIPIFGSTYGLLKQVLEAVFSSGGKSFKRAVLVEFPLAGSWAIGFVTQPKASDTFSGAAGQSLLSVFVPTTPNPTSGFYLLVEKGRVRELDMPVDQAFKVMLTMGIAESDPEALTTTAKWSRDEILKGG